MGLICRGIKLWIKFRRVNRYRLKYEKAKLLGATTSPIVLKEAKKADTKRKKFIFDLFTCFIWRKKSYDEVMKKVKAILTHKETYQLVFFLYGLLFAWILFAISYFVGSDNRSFLILKSVSLVTVISFAMAYSRDLRCITSLLVPIVLSSKGRYIILVVIGNLLLYGPITNIRVNLSENGRIIKCVAEIILDQVKQFAKQNPVVDFLRNLIKKVNQMFKTINKQLKYAFKVMKKLFNSTLLVLNHVKIFAQKVANTAKRFLAEVRGWCGSALGNLIKKCWAEWPWPLRIYCAELNLLYALCWVGEKLFTLIPTIDIDKLTKFFDETFGKCIQDLNATWDAFSSAFVEFFNFDLTMSHKKVVADSTKANYTTALDDLHKTIDSRMGIFLRLFKVISYFGYLLFLYCVLRAWLYLRRFRLWDSFDNVYITSQIHKIDWERSLAGKSTILPLGYVLSRKYISPFSIRMTPDELRKLEINCITYCMYLVCVGIFMVLEHIIYAPLALTKKYITDLDTEIPLPTIKVVTQPEKGALADVLKRSGDAPSRVGNVTSPVDSIAKCTPDPIQPDYGLYENIAILSAIVFIAILLESYALRMRFIIAGTMYPSRKFARATWLYNRILSMAPLAKQDAKDKMRDKVKGKEKKDGPSQIKRLMYLNPITTKIYNLLAPKQKYCIVCGQSGPLNDVVNFIKCINLDCKANYCKPCYSEFDKACSICEAVKIDPKVAEIDEEKGSSEDDDIFRYVYDDDWTYRGLDTESEPEMDLKKLELRPPKDFSRYLKPRHYEDGPVDSDVSTDSEKNYRNVKHRGRNFK